MDSFGGGYYVDEKAARVENIFLEFLKRYNFFALISPLFCDMSADFVFMLFSFRLNPNSREPHYESEIEAMKPNESNTMFIDFSHVMRFNDVLQKAISDEFLRYFLKCPFLEIWVLCVFVFVDVNL